MKNLFYAMLLLIGTTIFSTISAQTSSENIRVSFDSTKTDSPLFVYGEVANVENLKGLHITLSHKKRGSDILNDTLFITQAYGNYYTNFHAKKYPINGRKINHSIPVNANEKGELHCTIVFLYKNGTKEIKQNFELKK